MPNIQDFFNKIESLEIVQTPQGVVETIKEYYVQKTNIADMIDEETLISIGDEVKEGYDSDKSSMSEWEDIVKNGLEVAKPELRAKNVPWQGAANYKSPIITEAAYKFSDSVVGELLGKKDLIYVGSANEDNMESAENYATFANWQLNEEMECWRDEQESLIYNLPFIGTAFKMCYWDAQEQRPDSVLITYPDFAVNNEAKSIDRLQRFSYTVNYSDNEIESKIRSGVWIDYRNYKDEDTNEFDEESSDENQFIVQQAWFDLDDDGYEEPYTVTINAELNKVCRITPLFDLDEVIYGDDGEIVKINKIKNIIKYGFLKDPCGGLLDVGYCYLLSAPAHAINAAMNMLLDAGALANTPGGFIAKNFKMRMGQITIAPGQWIQTGMSSSELMQGMLPNPTKEPSATLYQLMQTITQQAKESSASINMASAIGANAPAATTLGLLMDQQQSAVAIVYRILRSMTKEFDCIYEINKKYVDPMQYKKVVGKPAADANIDFKYNLLIQPSANADVSSKVIRIQQASAAMGTVEQTLLAGGNAKPLLRYFLESINFKDVNEVIPDPIPAEQLQAWISANPELYSMIMDEKSKQDALAMQEIQKAQLEQAKVQADIEEKVASAAEKQASVVAKQADAAYTMEKTKTEDIDNSIKKAAAPAEIDQVYIDNQKTIAEINKGKMI